MPTISNLMSRLIWPMLGLVGGLLVLAGLLWWIKAWLRDSSEDDGCSPLLLSEYREMVARGELSEEEYRRIKDGMVARMGTGSSPTASRSQGPVRRLGSAPVPNQAVRDERPASDVADADVGEDEEEE